MEIITGTTLPDGSYLMEITHEGESDSTSECVVRRAHHAFNRAIYSIDLGLITIDRKTIRGRENKAKFEKFYRLLQESGAGPLYLTSQ